FPLRGKVGMGVVFVYSENTCSKPLTH
ncbi:MAG: hypothetical protein JWM26_4489, partial [Betaproteobacteria bacterium]|nr:hypothetical protein [Betaproteobacteria bacterium]